MSGMDQRRPERTSDPARLARHLGASVEEIADTARQVDKADLSRTSDALAALQHQLQNAAYQIREHREAIRDSLRFSEPPEFDVITAWADTGHPVDQTTTTQ